MIFQLCDHFAFTTRHVFWVSYIKFEKYRIFTKTFVNFERLQKKRNKTKTNLRHFRIYSRPKYKGLGEWSGHTRHSPDVRQMTGYRLRRWPNNKKLLSIEWTPIPPIVSVVFCISANTGRLPSVGLMLRHRMRRWPSNSQASVFVSWWVVCYLWLSRLSWTCSHCHSVNCRLSVSETEWGAAPRTPPPGWLRAAPGPPPLGADWEAGLTSTDPAPGSAGLPPDPTPGADSELPPDSHPRGLTDRRSAGLRPGPPPPWSPTYSPRPLLTPLPQGQSFYLML